MTPIDDLHVNQWVAIVDERDEELHPLFGMPMRPTQVTGQPLQIVAMSLPFIAVSDGRNRFSVDTRKVNLQVLHKKYVREMRGRWQRVNEPSESPRLVEPAEDKKRDREGCCPICGEKLIQRLRDSAEGWMFACTECGFEGGFGKDGAV